MRLQARFVAVTAVLSFAFAALTAVPAAAAGGTVTMSIAGTIGTGVSHNVDIDLAGFAAGNYQATVKIVDSLGADAPNGVLAQTATTGLASVFGHQLSSGSKLGFSGSLADVVSALDTVTWTPSRVAAGNRLLVTVATRAGENQFYSSATGRYYEYVSGSNITWSDAKTGAAAKTLNGLKGYLVHITTAAENEFIANETSASNIWIGATDTAAGSFLEGEWRWDGAVVGTDAATLAGAPLPYFAKYSVGVTTPDSSADGYVNWSLTIGSSTVTIPFAGWASGEPNGGTSESCAVTNWSGSKGRWNDLPCAYAGTGYLVEYGGRSDDTGATNTAVSASAEQDFTVSAVVPSAPALSSVTSGVGALTVTFTQGSTGGAALTNYQYSTDGGATFRALAIPDTTSPVTISTLSSDGSTALGNGTTYAIQLRAVTSVGNSTASESLSATTSAVAPGAPVITAVSLADKRVSVTFTSGSNGGSTVTNYEYSTDGGSTFFSFSPAQTTSPLVITALSTNGTTVLANGTTYPVQIRAENAIGSSVASNLVSATPAAPVPAPTSAPGTTQATPEAPTTVRVAPRFAPTPAALTGPVLRGNAPPVPSATPSATVNGRPEVVTSTVTGSSGVSLRAGSFTVGMTVPENQGGVTRQGTSTQVNVQQGASTPLQGSGVLPGSTVQVFLPLQGGNAKEIGRIASDSTGSFSGNALFATGIAEAPMPVGRQVLQIVSVAPNGQQTVVEMTINIGQSAPAPESNRQTQQLPALTPGASLATEAGIPVSVRVSALEEQKQVTVEGDGWSMAVDLTGEGGTVRSTEGGATMELVRNETALVSGSGFMPGFRADVWLFSTPTLLGTVTIDAEGNFVGEINVDPNAVAVGEHTLQLQAVGQDGYVRAANVGVVVSDPVAGVAVSTDEVAGTFLWWLWLLIALLVTAAVIVGIRYSRRSRA
jgi:hypothetical protein